MNAKLAEKVIRQREERDDVKLSPALRQAKDEVESLKAKRSDVLLRRVALGLAR